MKLLKLSATRFFSLKGPGLPRQYYEEKLKEILQFCNKEKSHDFNKNSLKTQLRMFSVNFSKQDDTMPSRGKKCSTGQSCIFPK